MIFFRGRRQKPTFHSVLGVDLSSAFVRMVELSVNKNGSYSLVNAASEEIPSSASMRAREESLDGMANSLTSLLKRSDSQATLVAMSLPLSLATTGTIALLESFSHSEREQQIELEIEAHVPYPLEQAAWDYAILGPSFTQPGEQDVQWFAVEKNRVDDRLKLAQAAQLDLSVLEIDSHINDLVLSKWIVDSVLSRINVTVALLEIGNASSKLRALRQGEWIFERELALAKQEWQSFPFDATAQTWTQEIKAALDTVVFQSSTFPCKHLFLTGDVSDLMAIERWRAQFAKVVNLEVTWLNPFRDILQIKSGLPDAYSSDFSAQQYMQACGLALRLLL